MTVTFTMETCSNGDLDESIFSKVLGQKPDWRQGFSRELWGKDLNLSIESIFQILCCLGE